SVVYMYSLHVQILSFYDCVCESFILFFFVFNDTASTEIYTRSLHDALPIYDAGRSSARVGSSIWKVEPSPKVDRSEEHTSELQSHLNLVCRLLLEKEKCPQEKMIESICYRLASTAITNNPQWQRELTASPNFFFLKIGPPPNSQLFPHPPLYG